MASAGYLNQALTAATMPAVVRNFWPHQKPAANTASTKTRRIRSIIDGGQHQVGGGGKRVRFLHGLGVDNVELRTGQVVV